MKKIFAIISAVCFVSVAVAQEKPDTKFRFGFKVAPSLAWLKPDIMNYSSNGSRIGFIYGLMMDYNFSKNYALSTGIEISYRGGKLKYAYANNSNVSFSGEDTYNLKYIEIPLTIKMKTNEIGYITYFGQFGFQPAFNIAAKSDFSHSKTNPSQVKTDTTSSDIDISGQIASLNVSLLFALGLEYRISGNTAIMAALQFSNGFTDVLTGKNPDDPDTELKAISNYMSLNVGVFF
ncbi:MAG TPA: porin family protein [Bacteroidia bacterium]|nr:porin family protein [Bacteroidia bacterium]